MHHEDDAEQRQDDDEGDGYCAPTSRAGMSALDLRWSLKHAGNPRMLYIQSLVSYNARKLNRGWTYSASRTESEPAIDFRAGADAIFSPSFQVFGVGFTQESGVDRNRG